MNGQQVPTGKAALLTGASRHQGRAYAEALARHGADIVVHYRPAARADADETARIVVSQRRRVVTDAGDLTDSRTRPADAVTGMDSRAGRPWALW